MLLAATLVLAFAQTPRFEAVSIKPHMGTRYAPGAFQVRSGRWSASGIAVADVIQFAWHLHPGADSHGAEFELNAPGWITNTRFDIVATTAGPTATDDELRAMLRAMLADRFALVIHATTKAARVYTLDAPRGAARLTPTAAGNCVTSGANPARRVYACGLAMIYPDPSGHVVVGRAATMADLALCLETRNNFLERHAVIDATGISGRFDFDVPYTTLSPQATSTANGDGSHTVGVDADSAAAVIPANLAALQKALAQSLGLEFILKPKTLPVPAVFIERISLPTAD